MHDMNVRVVLSAVMLLYSLAQAVFCGQFLRAAFRMRSDVLLSLRRKLEHESPVREHVTSMIMWLAISGLFMIVNVVFITLARRRTRGWCGRLCERRVKRYRRVASCVVRLGRSRGLALTHRRTSFARAGGTSSWSRSFMRHERTRSSDLQAE